MHAFELHQPASLADAIARSGKNVVYKAAGLDLIDLWKERVEAPATVVNLLALGADQGLRGVRADSGGVAIGALATLAEVADDTTALAGSGFAALREAAAGAASPQLRHRATVGGNLLQKNRCWYYRSAGFGCSHNGRAPGCRAVDGESRYHAVLGQTDCYRVHPSSLAPALYVLDAVVHVHGKKGERTLPITQLYPEIAAAAAPEHTLAADEVLLAVRVPAAKAHERSAFRESRERQAFDWATTAAAVRLGIEGGRITSARICLGAVAPVPLLAEAAAKSLLGKAPSAELFAQAAAAAYAGARPLAHNAYKIQVGQSVLVDALHAATR